MPPKGYTHTHVEPWRRPGILPLPTLEYGSDLDVWQWRVKLVLKHLHLWKFIAISSAPQNPSDAEKDDARYCGALLALHISEPILSDILTVQLALAPRKDLAVGERELPDEPVFLFEQAIQMVKAMQMIRKSGNRKLRDFVSGHERPVRAEDVFKGLYELPLKDNTMGRWHHIVLNAILLIRKNGLADLTGADVQHIIERACKVNCLFVEKDFTTLKDKVMEARRQQFSALCY